MLDQEATSPAALRDHEDGRARGTVPAQPRLPHSVPAPDPGQQRGSGQQSFNVQEDVRHLLLQLGLGLRGRHQEACWWVRGNGTGSKARLVFRNVGWGFLVHDLPEDPAATKAERPEPRRPRLPPRPLSRCISNPWRLPCPRCPPPPQWATAACLLPRTGSSSKAARGPGTHDRAWQGMGVALAEPPPALPPGQERSCLSGPQPVRKCSPTETWGGTSSLLRRLPGTWRGGSAGLSSHQGEQLRKRLSGCVFHSRPRGQTPARGFPAGPSFARTPTLTK